MVNAIPEDPFRVWLDSLTFNQLESLINNSLLNDQGSVGNNSVGSTSTAIDTTEHPPPAKGTLEIILKNIKEIHARLSHKVEYKKKDKTKIPLPEKEDSDKNTKKRKYLERNRELTDRKRKDKRELEQALSALLNNLLTVAYDFNKLLGKDFNTAVSKFHPRLLDYLHSKRNCVRNKSISFDVGEFPDRIQSSHGTTTVSSTPLNIISSNTISTISALVGSYPLAENYFYLSPAPKDSASEKLTPGEREARNRKIKNSFIHTGLQLLDSLLIFFANNNLIDCNLEADLRCFYTVANPLAKSSRGCRLNKKQKIYHKNSSELSPT